MTDRPEFSHKKERHGVIGPFSGRQLVVAFAAVIALAVILVGVTTPLGTTANGPAAVDPRATAYILSSPPPVGLKIGATAPDFAVTDDSGSTYQLDDLDGNPIRLADLKGKAVWVNFFASWCPPCQSETPVLRDIADRYRDRGLEVVGISVQETNADDVRAYAERYQLDYTIAADLTGEIFRLYRLWGLPTSFFIAPDGGIRSVVLAPLTEAGAQAQVEAILPKN